MTSPKSASAKPVSKTPKVPKVAKAPKAPVTPKVKAPPKAKAEPKARDTPLESPTAEVSDQILNRIRKMLAIASDARGNEHETATAARQAANLMQKYNVTMKEVIGTAILKDHSMIVEENCFSYAYRHSFPLWVTTTAIAVAQAFDCSIRQVRCMDEADRFYGQLYLHLFGYKSDVEVAKWVLTYLIDRQSDLADKYWTGNSSSYKAQGKTSQAVRTSYLMGLSANLRDTLTVYTKERDEIILSSGSSLMVIKTAAVEEKFGEFKYVLIKNPASVRQANYDGRDDAAKISLNKVLEGAEEKLAIAE